MTITRRWQSGAEADTTNSHMVEFDSVVGNLTTSNTQAKTGTYSYRVQSGQVNACGAVGISGTRQFRAGFHLYCAGALGTGVSDQPYVVAWLDGGGTMLGRVEANGPDELKLYANGGYQGTADCLVFDTWQRIGVDVKVDSTAGWIKVYWNGIEVLSYSGDTGDANVVCLVFGNATSPDNWDDHTYYDDLFVDDTTGETGAGSPPDYRFEYITADGNGTNSDLDGSDGNQVDNYALADDQPHDADTSYLYTGASGDIDTYAMTTKTVLTGWHISAIIPCAVARKLDAAVASQFSLAMYSGSTDWAGVAKNLATSYKLISERQTTDPDTSAAWTQAGLTAVECGVKSAGTF